MRDSIKTIARKYKMLVTFYRIINNSFSVMNRKFMYPLFNQHRLKQKLKGIDKLNLGCGLDLLRGWLNIGLFPDLEIPYGTVKMKKGALLLNFDLTQELSIQEKSIKYIYASHFVEHISFKDVKKILEWSYKVMEDGGVIRLTFPDLGLWINNYAENNTVFFQKYYQLTKDNNELPDLKTKGEIFMSQVNNWGHKWGYDFESMKRILEEAGFTDVKMKKPYESIIPNIKTIEPGSEGRLLETAYVEAKK
jgi:predicted SAM-dependent methyltransferase